MPKKLNLVLPCFNPPEHWHQMVTEQFTKICGKLSDCEIQLSIVNDGSRTGISDNAISMLKTAIPNLQYLSYEINRGKGYALRYGFKNISEADAYIYTDLDFPYTTESFIKIATSLLDNKADIIAGVKDENYYRNVPFFRKWISKLLRFLSRMLLGMPNTDTQCGLKGFNKKGKKLFMATSIDRFLFDLEFLFMASRNKDINTYFQEITLREGVLFSKVNYRILFTELANFTNIFIRKILKLG